MSVLVARYKLSFENEDMYIVTRITSEITLCSLTSVFPTSGPRDQKLTK